MRISVLQHVDFEGPGYIETWAKKKGHSLSITRLDEGKRPPSLDSFDLLIIMGGPMATHEGKKYLWLKPEKEYIADAIAAKKMVLGLCLGAQLIAEALDCDIHKNPYKEVGFFDVNINKPGNKSPLLAKLPKKFNAFHWHSDTFDLPLNTESFISSSVCENQGFCVGEHVLALQFHLETTPEIIESMIKHCGTDLTKGNYINTAEELKKGADKCKALNKHMATILQNFANAL